MSGYSEDYVEEGRERMFCFGNYYDKDGHVCPDGESGACNYRVECQRNYIWY